MQGTQWLVLTVSALVAPLTAARAQAGLGQPWDSVGSILQAPGTFAGGYYRYNLPRTDLTVRIGDVAVATPLASGAWAGFSGDPKSAMVMGDLVLTTSELTPVLAALSGEHIGVTAVHNHLVGEEPRITYVHFEGEGAATDLARRLNAAVALTATPRPVAAPRPTSLTIDTTMVFMRLGRSGRAQGGVAQVSFVLVPDTVRLRGSALVPALAYGTPINIQAVSPSRAVATGDFAVPGSKVQPVLSALSAGGITVTATHSHLIGESPPVYYIHFWADASLGDVLNGLKSALDAAK